MNMFPPVKMHPCPRCGTEQALGPPSGRYRDCPCGARIRHTHGSYVDGWAMWAFLTGWGVCAAVLGVLALVFGDAMPGGPYSGPLARLIMAVFLGMFGGLACGAFGAVVGWVAARFVLRD